MARQVINRGNFSNDHAHADSIYVINGKINDMTLDLYSLQSQIISAGDIRFAAQPTVEAKVEAACVQAETELKTIVFVPAVMIPHDATLVGNHPTIRRVREGGDYSTYDVQAYGADPMGTLDSGAAWNDCRAAIPASGGVMRVTNGTYKLTTPFTFGAQQNVTVQIDAGVTLTGSALPVVTGASPVSPDFNAYVDLRGGIFTLTNRLRFVTNASPNAPTLVDHVETVFNGTVDPSIYIGYNQSGLGNVLVAGEPGAVWGIEGNYNDGSGQNKMEAYVQFLAADLSAQRPFFASYNRVTKKAQPFIYGDTINLGRDNQTEPIAAFTNDGVNGNRLTINPTTSANGSYLVINGKVGTNAYVMFGITGTNLAQLQCSTQNRMDVLVNNRATAYFYATPLGGAGDAFAVGVDDNSAVGMFNNSSGSNGLKGVVARGKSGQTGFLFEAQSNTPTTLWAVTAAGFMQVGANQVVSARKTGWTAWTGTAARGTQNADGPPTLTQVAQAFKALVDDLISHGLIGT